MSKMRIPEMSVVRFDESDVICASIIRSIRFENYNDSGKSGEGNGKVIINDITYNRYSGGSYGVNMFERYGIESGAYGPTISLGGSEYSGTHSWSTIIDNDQAGTPSGVVDGEYEWNGNMFRWIDQ